MKLINETTKEQITSNVKQTLDNGKVMVAKSQDNLEKAALEVEKQLNRYVRKYTDVVSSTFSDLCSTAFDLVNYDLVSENVKDGKLIYSIDMPGVKIEDVEISYLRNTVVVKASRKDHSQKSIVDTTFNISQFVDPDTAKASLENGVLSISFIYDSKPQEFKKISLK